MVKIKQKKQLNLPQLIGWAWNNGIKNERYKCSDSIPYEYVWINGNSDVEFDDDVCISKNDTFTVEEEIEITEDTVIPKLIEVYNIIDEQERIVIHENSNIYSNVDSQDSRNFKSLAFYILNEDLTMTLIWTKDKGLVE